MSCFITPPVPQNTKEYNSFFTTNNIDPINDTWAKELVLNKIILYIRYTELAGPGTAFMVGELETMYVEMLDGHGIAWSTHVSQFAELLLSRVPGLLKGLSGNKLSMFFYSAVQNNIQNAQDFFESLVNIVEPIKQAMRLKCQSTDANLKFDRARQIESLSIELLTLVNFILKGINLSEKGFSKESLTLAQAMFNFCFNRDGKRRSLKKRHDQTKETPFPLYVAIKVHSHSCSKTMINWLHFCAGISISYNQLLDITRDLANRILHQDKHDGVFIPCNLKTSIFTIIAKGNIDHNARSKTATKHYHRTSFSVFSLFSHFFCILQFPSVVFPGDMIS